MKSNFPAVAGVGTAVPPHRLPQTRAREFAERFFRGSGLQLDRLLTIFENTKIESRYLACPLEWYEEDVPFSEVNRIYLREAVALSVRAARTALERSGVVPAEIGGVVFVSSTGIATPSLDVEIIQELGLPSSSFRVPLWGLGCAGGVSGLARAAQLSAASQSPVLLVAVELCTLTFQRNDLSKANLVATSLFADGAAAVVLVPRGERDSFKIIDHYSYLFPNSQFVMGWDLVDGGLKVRFDRSIPQIAEEKLPQVISRALDKWGVARGDLRHFLFHPGGAKVIEAYRKSLQIPDEKLLYTEEILKKYGNMSSPTVIFSLEKYLEENSFSGELGLMLALGPGFSAETILFEF